MKKVIDIIEDFQHFWHIYMPGLSLNQNKNEFYFLGLKNLVVKYSDNTLFIVKIFFL